MTSTDPAGFTNESTGTHPIPLHLRETLARMNVPDVLETTTIPVEDTTLWFTTGRMPDGTYRTLRVDDPESGILDTETDQDFRTRHLLRALLQHTLDMLNGEDNS